MQTLDVISVNIWQIVISLCNLVIIFLILKRFLYKPVKKMLAARQAEIDKQYQDAKDAQEHADENKRVWDEKISTANNEADRIIKEAEQQAQAYGQRTADEARRKADIIMADAKQQADGEYRRLQGEIRDEIVEVSAEIAEKLLVREISEQDHRNIIDAAIEQLGDRNESDS